MNREEIVWKEELYRNLRKVARKYGFHVSVIRGGDNSKGDFAEFIISIDAANMLGLKLNPPLAVKPFQIFPQGKDIGLDEIDEFLEGYALMR